MMESAASLALIMSCLLLGFSLCACGEQLEGKVQHAFLPACVEGTGICAESGNVLAICVDDKRLVGYDISKKAIVWSYAPLPNFLFRLFQGRLLAFTILDKGSKWVVALDVATGERVANFKLPADIVAHPDYYVPVLYCTREAVVVQVAEKILLLKCSDGSIIQSSEGWMKACLLGDYIIGTREDAVFRVLDLKTQKPDLVKLVDQKGDPRWFIETIGDLLFVFEDCGSPRGKRFKDFCIHVINPQGKELAKSEVVSIIPRFVSSDRAIYFLSESAQGLIWDIEKGAFGQTQHDFRRPMGSFSGWLICRDVDERGDVISYTVKRESDGIAEDSVPSTPLKKAGPWFTGKNFCSFSNIVFGVDLAWVRDVNEKVLLGEPGKPKE
ncbi:MAG: hypothetical protein WC712_09725 [Candidatus Brocadiia bacterium]